jgi:sulfite reductase (NADPH) flavoprotein alpha-component
VNQKVDFPNTVYPISSDVLEVLEQFEQQQLSWLSGYCAGLAKGRSSEPLSADSPVTQPPLVATADAVNKVATVQILYASQTGNAKAVAESLFDTLKTNYRDSSKLKFSVDNVNSIKPKILSQKQLLIFVASTHGEGEPPDDAIEFIERLESKRAPKLKGVQHAVLGLGDSSYEFFCQTGKDIERLLTKSGSSALLDRVDCDLDYEPSVNQWIVNLNTKVSQLVENEPADHIVANEINSPSTSVVNNKTSKTNPFAATVLANQQITASGADKRVQHIELSIENSGISYQPGDGVGVWAKNDPKSVSEILKLTGLSKDVVVEFKQRQYKLFELLHERLEISLINRELIKKYYQIAKAKGVSNAERLNHIVNDSFADFSHKNQVADVFAIASVELEAQQLVDLLKPIKPRVYSIASSLQANLDEIHITVKLVESINDKTVRKGTASRYLIEELQLDQEVMIYIEENHRFRLPEEDKDILMIGPGTGVAPFRAFLQEREEQQASGNNWLFFGNSHFNSEFLYQLELQSYLKSGLLSKLSLAFSRDQAEKIYVQDRMKQNAAAIWHWIDHNKAHFYVCGDKNFMANDVESTLLEIIRTHGKLTVQQADDYLKALRKSGRYQRDVY